MEPSPPTTHESRTDKAALDDLERRFKQMTKNCDPIIKDRPGFRPSFVRDIKIMVDAELEHVSRVRQMSITETPDITLRPAAVGGRKPAIQIIVDDPEQLPAMIDLIVVYQKHQSEELNLFLDTEGDEVNGGLSWFQIFLRPANIIYILDILTLGLKAFISPGSCGKTLQDLLKSPTNRKALWGLAGDAHILATAHNINMVGVDDLALRGIAFGSDKRRDRTPGLSDYIVDRCKGWFTESELERFKENKAWGKATFRKDHGTIEAMRDAQDGVPLNQGTPTFNQRPALVRVLEYCYWDVFVMPVVYDRICEVMKDKRGPFAKLEDTKWKADYPELWVELSARKEKLGCETWAELIEKKARELLERSKRSDYDAERDWEKGVPEWTGLG